MSRRKLIYEDCLEEAKKYKTLSEFTSAKTSMYQVVLSNGWLDKIIKEAELVRRVKNNSYTYENVLKIAKGFKTVYGWKTNNFSSYNWATKHGYVQAIKKELNLITYYYDENEFTFDECIEEAKKYNNVHNWRQNGITFRFSEKKNWVEDIAARVGFSKGKRKKLWWYNL